MNRLLFLDKNNLHVKNNDSEGVEYSNQIVAMYDLFRLEDDWLSTGQRNILEQIVSNKLLIEKQLKPLTDAGVTFNLTVVGGCLRETMLNNTDAVNDYDFVISVSIVTMELLLKVAKTMDLDTDKLLSSDEFVQRKDFLIKNCQQLRGMYGSEFNWNDALSIQNEAERDIIFSHLVKKLMCNLKGYKFLASNNVSEEYLNTHISGISQFVGVGDKKVDLIVSDYGNGSHIHTFDFEICKIYADLKGVKNVSDLVNNIVPSISMLRDLNDKTISLNAIKFNQEHMNYFFNKHFLKLTSKYPDYKLNLYIKKPIEELTVEEKNRWIFATKCKMEIELKIKGMKENKHKI